MQRQTSISFQCLELGAGVALPSLFLGHLFAGDTNPPVQSFNKALLHITDGKQYRNIRQILFSLSRQPKQVLKSAFFRVSPHNWGKGVDEEDGSFLAQECPDAAPRSYDLVIVSDCIYNPTYHRDLLKTIAATLRLPEKESEDEGGRAILSFSLHGNTPDKDIWDFVDKVVPETRHGHWRMQARRVKHDFISSLRTTSGSQQKPQPVQGRHGWDMESTMKDLGLWTANIEPKRWFSFVYEITWTKE
ncbi:MAG: hypothetical protein SGILL_001814 [Bacillariaceae sp.]